MWHGRSAKQRVWVGPDRYRGRCRDAVTNPVAESYANPNSYACCMRSGKSNTYAHGNGNCHSNGYCDSYRYSYFHTYAHAYCYAQAHAHTEVSANTEGSSHTAAAAVAEKVISD